MSGSFEYRPISSLGEPGGDEEDFGGTGDELVKGVGLELVWLSPGNESVNYVGDSENI